MEGGFHLLKYNGHRRDLVLDCWSEPATVSGMVWRLILDEGRTLEVVPYQTPSCPAQIARVPERIDPVMAGQHCMGDYALAVQGLAREDTKAARKELRDVLKRYGIPKFKQGAFGQLCQFIKGGEVASEWDVLLEAPSVSVNIALGSEEALRQVADRVHELTGIKIAEKVMCEYSPGMAAHLNDWVRDSAKDFGMDESVARKNLLDRVRWVADFGDGHMWIVESLREVRHSSADAKRWELAKKIGKEAANAGMVTETLKGKEPEPDMCIRDVDGKVVFRVLAPSFAEVEFNGQKLVCPPKGRKVVQTFLKHYHDSEGTALAQDDVLTSLGHGETLRDCFKGRMDTWKQLFRSRQGTRDLYDFIPAVLAEESKD